MSYIVNHCFYQFFYACVPQHNSHVVFLMLNKTYMTMLMGLKDLWNLIF